MRKIGFVIVAAFVLLVSAMAQPKQVPLAGDRKKAAQVWATFEKWLAAYSARDLKGTMAIFDPQVVFAFQGVKDQTFADLEASYQADFAARNSGEWVPEVQEVRADRSLAFVRSVWIYRIRSEDGSLRIAARNRSIDIFQLGADRTWRIIRSLNYPEKN